MGGIIYTVGVILASFSQDPRQLWLLVVGHGVISGFGFGYGSVLASPIAQ
jgi:OFA family oxalate/formate antiporter-like MFS transporter